MLTGDQDPTLPLFLDGTLGAETQSPRPSAVLILGPPGCGKGTQASLLSEAWQIPHISTGDMLRQRALASDDFGKRIAGRIDQGQFVPDEWMNLLLDERLSQPDCRRGMILDGYPRTLTQAQRFWESSRHAGRSLAAVRLRVSAGELARRFRGRRQCSICGALFHLELQPSLRGDSCDRPGCDGVLDLRQDDRPEFLERRLHDFESLTAPVIAFLGLRCRPFVVVEADGVPPEDVHARVLAGLSGSPGFSPPDQGRTDG